MKREFFSYLKSYSVDPKKVDRIIVSNFLYSNNVERCNNKLIDKLRIKKDDLDYEEFEKITKSHSIVSIEDLIEAFEFVVSPEEKIVTGAVYTPSYIREYIVNQTIHGDSVIASSFRVCDPACGCSGFLYTVAKRIKQISGRSYYSIFKENLFGLDIKNFSVQRSELLLTLAAIIDGEDEESFAFNIHLGNALSFKWNNHIDEFTGFDSIVGNPPYVCSRNIDEESKDLVLNWSVSKSGHPDLYIPFFELGIAILKPSATLGYITMNTFFKSVNGRALREYFQNQKLNMDILDFGSFQVFESKSTYTCICLINNSHSDVLNYVKLSNIDHLLSDGMFFDSINYESLDTEKGWNLQERDILNKIESVGTPLGKKFTSRNGIATLKNDVYIFEPVEENGHLFNMQNGKHYPIEREACVDVINPNKLTKLDSIDSLRKKIIFPYEFEKGQPTIIPEEKFRTKFPNTYNYLLSKKELLAKRDKGKGRDYEFWYAYGRNQSLERYPFKLFFPHISPSIPNYVINDESSLLFVNGLAIVGENKRELEYLSKIMSSRLFWFYIVNSSKPYGSGYYSLSSNYIKNFGIFDFSDEQIEQLIELRGKKEIDDYLEQLYGVTLNLPERNLKSQSITISDLNDSTQIRPVKECI
ncbi:MAG: N-6 DNA methylase [Cytophagales bacterium]|nr:N-6 DNA methylase [Cytophagales bacterium]